NGNHKHRARFGAVFRAEPVREVDENAGKETGFADAEKNSNQVEMHGRSNERNEDGNQSPGNHNAREPFARAPALDDEAAGNFEEQIADKKDSRTEAEDAVAERKVMRHLESGIADVHAIEKRDDEQSEKIGQEPPRNTVARGQTNARCGRGCIHPAW